jgi:subtilisin family serine protease
MPGSGSNASHGTHVAGIAAASGNNGVGISGAAWNAKIMAIKGFPDFGQYAKISDLLSGIYYAVNNGAHIINASWGSSYEPGQAEIDAFQFALDNNVIPIVAAGNEALVAQFTTPAGIPGVFTVGSINSSIELSQFSNYGNAVDILAPGGDSTYGGWGSEEYILSTYPTDVGGYGLLKGTSMAAPYVSGVAALIKSVNMELSARD